MKKIFYLLPLLILQVSLFAQKFGTPHSISESIYGKGPLIVKAYDRFDENNRSNYFSYWLIETQDSFFRKVPYQNNLKKIASDSNVSYHLLTYYTDEFEDSLYSNTSISFNHKPKWISLNGLDQASNVLTWVSVHSDTVLIGSDTVFTNYAPAIYSYLEGTVTKEPLENLYNKNNSIVEIEPLRYTNQLYDHSNFTNSLIITLKDSQNQISTILHIDPFKASPKQCTLNHKDELVATFEKSILLHPKRNLTTIFFNSTEIVVDTLFEEFYLFELLEKSSIVTKVKAPLGSKPNNQIIWNTFIYLANGDSSIINDIVYYHDSGSFICISNKHETITVNEIKTSQTLNHPISLVPDLSNKELQYLHFNDNIEYVQVVGKERNYFDEFGSSQLKRTYLRDRYRFSKFDVSHCLFNSATALETNSYYDKNYDGNGNSNLLYSISNFTDSSSFYPSFYDRMVYSKISGYKPVYYFGAMTWIAGIKENEKINISIYPNPSSSKISISSDLNTNFSHYSVVDMSGNIVQTGKLMGNTIQLKSLTNGSYALILDDDQTIYTKKFILIR
jgi:hypothetical protein